MSLISCKTFPPRYKDTSKYPKGLIYDASNRYESEFKNFLIVDAKVTEGILELKTQIPGNCHHNHFNLVFNEIWMKSMPPKVTLFLEHKDGNDQCNSKRNQAKVGPIKFNIKKLKEHHSEIIINLVGYSKSIKY